jgi:predicted  nucleic acid-binding Zn-ribbon protein
MTTLKADAEAMKKQFAELTTQKQALEDQVKEAEAKLAARPGTKPPLKAKKSS